MKNTRKATRRVTKVGTKLSLVDRLKHALKPSNIKAYWWSRQGAMMAAKIAGGGFVLLFLIFLFFAKDLPSPSKINSLIGAQTTKFYARDELANPGKGTLLYEVHGDVNRTVIPFDQMPSTIKNATIAIEDKDFYKHGAFSIFGIGRAFTGVITGNRSKGGGSTITQQYVKNALLTSQYSLTRKIKELILSIEIEQLYKKDDILKLYLNEIPYGHQAYGIQAAAKTYFKKDTKDLTLPEAALLAAIPNLPTYYDPYGNHQDALIERQHLILDQMVEQKYITRQEADDAKKVDVLAEMPKVPATYANVTAPYFVKYIEAQLGDKYGSQVVDAGGLKVITTLDPDMQKAAEAAVEKNKANVSKLGGSNAALVAADPKTGEVKAYVGGDDFSESQVNVADAERQPGSSFKPFVYATLFGKKDGGTTYGPGTTLYDVKTDFGGGYSPNNYCVCNYGAVSVRTAIGSSLNIPAVKALYLAGVPQSIKTAHDMGITTLNESPDHYGLSLVLGAGEVKLSDMVNAYGVFATGGTHVDQVTVLKITNSKNDVLEDNTKAQSPKKVLDPQVAYELNSIMSDASARTLTFGANFSPLIIPGRTTAVKTGTTENFRDAWTVGYTQSLVAGVWTGNNDGKSMSGSSGAVAAPIWHDFMVAATKSAANEPFARPAGIKDVTIDAITGRAVTDQTKDKRTDVFSSWYQPIPATAAQSAKIDKVSGKLATECTPPLAQDTAYSSSITAEVPPGDSSYPRWNPPVQALAEKLGYQAGASLPTEKDDRHSCSDTKPTVKLTVTDGGGKAHVTWTVTNGSPFIANKLEIKMDDQIVSTKDLSGSDSDSFDQAASSGSHTFTATVTDNGFYQGTDSKTVTVTPGTFQNVSPTGSASSPVNFQWGAKIGASSYNLKYKRSSDIAYTTLPNGASTSRSVPLVAGTYVWYVEALSGGSAIDQTNPWTVVVN